MKYKKLFRFKGFILINHLLVHGFDLYLDMGLGFGLGGSICIDENVGLSNSHAGDFGWGGAASTSFYISDKYDYSLVFLTQVLESEETRKLNSEIKKLVNGCVDVHKK